jgi:FG-GAP-like repeat
MADERHSNYRRPGYRYDQCDFARRRHRRLQWDHTDDILFRNDAGQVVTWSMQGGNIASIKTAGSAATTSHIQGTGDFNGDGRTDILFRGNDGHVIEWLMTSGHIASTQDIGSADASWKILGTGDLNGDDHEDILWDNDNGHVTAAWLLDNAGQLTSAQDIGHTPAGTQIGGSHFDLA